jgi:DNA-binding NarL/FixJ family response regulator
MSKGTVLLVDDDPLVLESLSLVLQGAEYAVTTALSGQEAIALCQQQAFEVVVCDIRMPGCGARPWSGTNSPASSAPVRPWSRCTACWSRSLTATCGIS